jgi:hypothetical protein
MILSTAKLEDCKDINVRGSPLTAIMVLALVV